MTTPTVRYDVIYRAGNVTLGQASSPQAAKSICARKIGHVKRANERWTARLDDVLDDDGAVVGKAWYCGVQLIPKHERGRQ